MAKAIVILENDNGKKEQLEFEYIVCFGIKNISDIEKENISDDNAYVITGGEDISTKGKLMLNQAIQDYIFDKQMNRVIEAHMNKIFSDVIKEG